MVDSEKVLLGGAGTMGCGIATVWARAGHRVLLYDALDDVRATAKQRICNILRQLADSGVIATDQIDPAVSLISSVDSLEAAAEATFIIEAVPEDADLKREVLGTLDKIAPPTAILATNTSSFTLVDLGANLTHRDRFLATHFYNPAYLVPLVEVATTPLTADWARRKAMALLEAIGKVPVHCQDSPGYIAVRIQEAMFLEAVAVLEQGLATADDIDKAVRNSFGLRLAVMGPLEMADRGGLDVWLNAADHLYRTFGNEKFRAPGLLREKVARGELGVKTGRGLHGDVDALVAAERHHRLIGLLQHLGLLPHKVKVSD